MSLIFIKNVNCQISNILQNNCNGCLPTNWQSWQQAGSSILNSGNGITIGECINATEHGIVADCATDNSAVLNGIISNCNSSGYTIIYFPAGAYKFNNTINIGKQKIILKGAGGADAPAQTHFHFDLPAGQNSCIAITNNYIGIEDIYFIQEVLNVNNPADFHTNTIGITGSNCWIRGVESYRTRRFHVEISGENNTVSGCYFHDAENYSDDHGRAYGVCISSGGNNNLVENNIFNHLRHSIVLQYYAQLNVIGYNYSSEPHGFNGGYNSTTSWSSRLPDLCFHGRNTDDTGPSGNLCEGNWVEKIGLDDEHGTNGVKNTFFRNYAEDKYNEFMDGFFIQFNNLDESIQSNQNIVACNAKPSVADWNKIHDYGFFIYWYSHSIWGLDEEWQYTPSDQYSYYKTAQPEFWNGYSWINCPYVPNGENPAKSRCWMADNYGNVTKAIYVGWDASFYTNMCGPCTFIDISITTVPAIQDFFQAVGHITASYAIPNSNPVTFVADNYIELNPGFETYDGGEFEAYIDDVNCDGSIQKIMSSQYNPPPSVETPSNKITKTDSVYFNLTPNPCKTFVQIEYSTNNDKDVIIEIYNIAGNKLKQLIYRGGKNTEILDISELTNGIYFYRAMAGNKQIGADKIVVLK